MTLEEVTCEDLEKTREQLVSVIARELTIQETLPTNFLAAYNRRAPVWITMDNLNYDLGVGL